MKPGGGGPWAFSEDRDVVNLTQESSHECRCHQPARLNGGTIHLPNRVKDRPDRDRLALRFERFKAVA
jgi:hypothetical protein